MAQDATSAGVLTPRDTEDEDLFAGSVRSPMAVAFHRLLRKKIAVIAIIYILIFYGAGASAPLLQKVGIIPSYTSQDLSRAEENPTWSHPFGTDRLGRDQLSRMVWAAQTTVIVTLATLLTGGLVLAVGLGLLSGYAGGWVDTLITRVGDAFASLPSILMLILINATLKTQVRGVAVHIEDFTGIHGIVNSGAPDYFLIFGALSLFSWVGGARIIRAQVLSLRETEFILAARATGASTSRIIYRHLLPNITNYIIVFLSLGLGGIAGSEIVLTWFGVGIQPPHPSFGTLLFESSASPRIVNEHPYLFFIPAGIVTILMLAFNLLGDALTDVFTPRTR